MYDRTRETVNQDQTPVLPVRIISPTAITTLESVNLSDFTPTNARPLTTFTFGGIEFDLTSVRYQQTKIGGIWYWVWNYSDLLALVTAQLSGLQSYGLPLLNAFLETQGTLVSRDFAISHSAQSMSDNVIPKYLERSRNGEIFNNPMESVKSSFNCSFSEDTPFFSRSVYVEGGQSVGTKTYLSLRASGSGVDKPMVCPSTVMDGIFSYMTQPVLPDPQPVVNNAVLAAQEGDFQVPTFLLEAPELVRLISYTMIRVKNIYSAIKKGRFKLLAPKTFSKWLSLTKKGKSDLTLDLISEAWLEARYAWRPLLIDVEKAYQLWLKQSQIPERQTFRASSTDSSSLNAAPVFYEDGIKYQVNMLVQTDIYTRAGTLVHVVDRSLHDQLGLGNVFGTIWEAIPFSFVVDWFVNLSGLLASLNPNVNTETLATWYSQRCSITATGTIVISKTGSAETKTLNFSASRQYYLRKPSSVTSSIHLDVNFDVFKLFDSLALLRKAR